MSYDSHYRGSKKDFGNSHILYTYVYVLCLCIYIYVHRGTSKKGPSIFGSPSQERCRVSGAQEAPKAHLAELVDLQREERGDARFYGIWSP